MKPIQVSGQVDSSGKLQLKDVPSLPIGEQVQVLILEQTDIAAIEQMIALVAGMDDVDPALMEQLETLDEALWDMQFAKSPNVFRKLADEARHEYEQGNTVPLDFDEPYNP
jgi:hypothetical protein